MKYFEQSLLKPGEAANCSGPKTAAAKESLDSIADSKLAKEAKQVQETAMNLLTTHITSLSLQASLTLRDRVHTALGRRR